jgi:hypothetical protein
LLPSASQHNKTVTWSLYAFPPWHFSSYNARVLCGCALQKSAISSRLIISFGAFWVTISFTFSCYFSAESKSAEAPSPLTEYHVMLCLVEMLQPSIGAFKINAYLQGCSSAFPFTVCPSTASLFFQSWQNPSNSLLSILPCFAPQILMHFKVSRLCKACFSIES